MRHRCECDTVLCDSAALVDQPPYVEPVPEKDRTPVLENTARLFFGVGRDARWRDVTYRACHKAKRVKCRRFVEVNGSRGGINPFPTVTPQDFEENGDQAFVLFTLPDKSPTIAALLFLCNTLEICKRCRRRRHQ